MPGNNSSASDEAYDESFESDASSGGSPVPAVTKNTKQKNKKLPRKTEKNSKRKTTPSKLNGAYSSNNSSQRSNKARMTVGPISQGSSQRSSHGTNGGGDTARQADKAQVQKRIMSASRMKINDLRNQVGNLQREVKELQTENRLLKRIEQRQMRALERFENAEDEIPQMLLQHHNEERALKDLYRKSAERNQKNEAKLREKDRDIEGLMMKIKRLDEISKKKGLPEKEELARRLEHLEVDLDEKQKKVRDMERTIELENKKHKHQLQIEFARHKDTQKRLQELENVQSSLEKKLIEKDKELSVRAMYQTRVIKPPHKLQTPSPHTSTRKKKARPRDDSTSRSDPLSKSIEDFDKKDEVNSV